MLKRSVLTLLLFILIITSSSALTADYTDYHIYEGYPDLNWDVTFLRIGYDDEQKEFITLIKFEQEYTTQIRATLRFDLYDSPSENDLTVNVYPITDWPAEVYYREQPTYGSAVRSLIIKPTQTSYTILLPNLPAGTKGIALRAARKLASNEKIITVDSLEIEGVSSAKPAVVATTTTTIDKGTCACSLGEVTDDYCNLAFGYTPNCIDDSICACEEEVYTPPTTTTTIVPPPAITPTQEPKDCKSCIRTGKSWCGGNGVDKCIVMEDGQECLRLEGEYFVYHIDACPVFLKADGEGCGDNSECDSGYCDDALCQISPFAKGTFTVEDLANRRNEIANTPGAVLIESIEKYGDLYETYKFRDDRQVVLQFDADRVLILETWSNPNKPREYTEIEYKKTFDELIVRCTASEEEYREALRLYRGETGFYRLETVKIKTKYGELYKEVETNSIFGNVFIYTHGHKFGYLDEYIPNDSMFGYDLGIAEYRETRYRKPHAEVGNHIRDVLDIELDYGVEHVVLERDSEGNPTKMSLYLDDNVPGRESRLTGITHREGLDEPVGYLVTVWGVGNSNDQIRIYDKNNNLVYSANLASKDGSFTGISSETFFGPNGPKLIRDYEKRGDYYEVVDIPYRDPGVELPELTPDTLPDPGQYQISPPYDDGIIGTLDYLLDRAIVAIFGSGGGGHDCATKCSGRISNDPYSIPLTYRCMKDEICLGDGVGKCVCEMEGDICTGEFVEQAGEGGGCSAAKATRTGSVQTDTVDRGLCTCDSQGNILTDDCNLPNNFYAHCYARNNPVCVCEEEVYTPTTTTIPAATSQESESCKSCIRAGKQWCGGNGVDECVILEDGQECLRLGGESFVTNLASCPLKKEGEGCGDNSECDSGYCDDALCKDILLLPLAKEVWSEEDMEKRIAYIRKRGTETDYTSSPDNYLQTYTYTIRESGEIVRIKFRGGKYWRKDGLIQRQEHLKKFFGYLGRRYGHGILMKWSIDLL